MVRVGGRGGGILFAIPDFLAFRISSPDDLSEQFVAETYAGWAAVSVFALLLLQVALIGLYAPQREIAGTLAWVGFFLAFFGMAVVLFIVLFYAFIALPGTPDAPEFISAGPPGASKYFPLFSLD